MVPHVPKLILAILCDFTLATLLFFLRIDSVVIPHRKCRKEYADRQVGQQTNNGTLDGGAREAETTHDCSMANMESWWIKVNKG